jgi:hypothetical protein
LKAWSLHLVILALLLMTGVALAQGSGPSPTPSVPTDTVPTWIFYWVLGIATFIAVIWAGVTKILWERGNKVSALSENERNQLQQLYTWHDKRDDDQIPLWYVPRSWLALVERLHDDHANVRKLLTDISRQNQEVIADLRAQLKESRGMQAQQQTKMLKLAVRVQRRCDRHRTAFSQKQSRRTPCLTTSSSGSSSPFRSSTRGSPMGRRRKHQRSSSPAPSSNARRLCFRTCEMIPC